MLLGVVVGWILGYLIVVGRCMSERTEVDPFEFNPFAEYEQAFCVLGGLIGDAMMVMIAATVVCSIVQKVRADRWDSAAHRRIVFQNELHEDSNPKD